MQLCTAFSGQLDGQICAFMRYIMREEHVKDTTNTHYGSFGVGGRGGLNNGEAIEAQRVPIVSADHQIA